MLIQSAKTMWLLLQKWLVISDVGELVCFLWDTRDTNGPAW